MRPKFSRAFELLIGSLYLLPEMAINYASRDLDLGVVMGEALEVTYAYENSGLLPDCEGSPQLMVEEAQKLVELFRSLEAARDFLAAMDRETSEVEYESASCVAGKAAYAIFQTLGRWNPEVYGNVPFAVGLCLLTDGIETDIDFKLEEMVYFYTYPDRWDPRTIEDYLITCL